MKCPHCSVTIHLVFKNVDLVISGKSSSSVGYKASSALCPACAQAIIFLERGNAIPLSGGGAQFHGPVSKYLVWPQSSLRPCASEVPSDLASDFSQAVRVFEINPQASAALTRRILQQVLREFAKTKSKDLADQIDEVIAEAHISPSLASQLDYVRVIGNFAAHPLKSNTTGLILPVEPNEAEWNLDVLEEVFDHYFVKPKLMQARKDALNLKLAEVGKQQLP